MTPEAQQQDAPGTIAAMNPTPDHGEESYTGSGRLEGKIAVITGGDSGIGRAVAIAFAREGADVVIGYLNEHEDAASTAALVEQAGRRALAIAGDLASPAECRSLIERTVDEFGRIDVLVSNAAFQRTHAELADIPANEWDRTLAVNLSAYFHLVQAAVPHMASGSNIIATSSIQADSPSPELLPYALTKAGITNMTASLAQLLAPKGIRANVVAPGPIWTPLIPATMDDDKVASFGDETAFGRPGQPAELAAAYVMLATDEASYISGAVIAATGGKPLL